MGLKGWLDRDINLCTAGRVNWDAEHFCAVVLQYMTLEGAPAQNTALSIRVIVQDAGTNVI